MSGAPDFDETVFDAPAAAEGAPAPAAKVEKDEAPEPDAPAEPKSKIEATAAKIGWSGKDEWRGDPADWVDAPEFILKAAGEVLPSMRKSLEEAKDEIKGLKAAVKTSIQHMSRARQEGYEQRSRELQAELAEYAKAGDVENVKSVTADIVALEKEVSAEAAPAPAANPDFEAFCEEHGSWFGPDKALTAAFNALTAEVIEEGYTKPKAGLKEALSRLKEAFPEKFAKLDGTKTENPNRRLPGAVESPGALPRQRGKSFSDMPAEHQAMCLDLMKQSKAITKENYAREYFAGEQR